jgi:hypothetical protein
MLPLVILDWEGILLRPRCCEVPDGLTFLLKISARDSELGMPNLVGELWALVFVCGTLVSSTSLISFRVLNCLRDFSISLYSFS